MNRRAALPAHLEGVALSAAELRAAGVSASRMRAKDLQRSARGVVMLPSRSNDTSTLEYRCRTLLPILNEHQIFSRRTAAQLWGLPSPEPPAGRVEIGSPHPSRAPRRPEVSGHRFRAGSVEVTRLRGLPAPTPEDTWCLLGGVVTWSDLVVVGDALVSGGRNTGGSRSPPLATPESLADAAGRYRGTSGSSRLRHALRYLRAGVDSPAETRLRLIIVLAGLPEPLVSCPVDVGVRVLHADLGYPDLRLAIEYEGRYHFIGGEERARFDVERIELMQSAGWRVLRATARDLRDPDGFCKRLHIARARALQSS